MKKQLLLFIIIICITLSFPLVAKAASQYTQECFYQDSSVKERYVQIKIGGIQPGGITPMVLDLYFYKITGSNPGEDREYYFQESMYSENYIVNLNKDFGTKFALFNHIMVTQDDAIDKKDLIAICPNEVLVAENKTETKIEKKYEVFFCGTNDFGDRCPEVDAYMRNGRDNHNFYTFKLYTGTISGVDWADPEKSIDVVDQFEDTINKADIVCDETKSTYDEEECNKLLLQSSGLVNTALDQGREREIGHVLGNFEDFQIYFPSVPIDCDELFINSKFGDILRDILNLIKYIAPILVIVLSTADYIKAIVAQDNDALKKSTQTAVKRLVLAIALFFIPILVTILLDIVSPDKVICVLEK